MSLHSALTRILEEYLQTSQQTFSNNPLANFIRANLPNAIRSIINNDERYLVKGSPGQGGWADVPWIAIFDRFVTETAQEGYYIVYLFREDSTGVYLLLNQGVTTIRKQYRADARKALQTRADDYLARIGTLEEDLIRGPINLAVSNKAGLGAFYEHGAICSKYYGRGLSPGDAELAADLLLFVDYYFKLVTRESALFDKSQQEEDEKDLGVEDLRVFRTHNRIERNRRLAAKVKRSLGLTCQACGFNFEAVYGPTGKDYIEAHHLIPLSKLKGQRVALDPKRDFAVLCANCHRMIHRSEYVSDVRAFRAHVIQGTQT
jgi:5-methylcytosine-specific restriction protein A